jgi:hypothetical protein
VSARLALLLACSAAGCLPEPPPKATIAVTIRGSTGPSGTAEFVTEDDHTIRFEKRLAVLAIAVTGDRSYSYGRGSVRNLDVAPFDANPLKAIDNRYLGVHAVTYYGGQTIGPGVTPEDLDLLDGDPAGLHARTNVSAFVMIGSIDKGERRVRFDWRGYLTGPSSCGHDNPGANQPLPVYFASESKHTLEVVMNTEYFFTAPGASGPRGAPFIAGDANADGVLSTSEAINVIKSGLASLEARLFTLRVDGATLSCASLSFGTQPF